LVEAVAVHPQVGWRIPQPDQPRLATENEAESVGEMPLERLQLGLDRALRGDYRPPPLFGLVLETASGNLRPLAVPPFFDRVLQRAVAQIINPALESSQYRHSYGYRAGRSRMNARDAVQAASRQGYQWVYESDIADFFDSVDRGRLEVRLRALYGEDPMVDLLLDWMGQPVEYQGQTIARKAGLPQGSPLSPAMANLMLDDFDGDMEVLGFKLIRFADDFVVLCKSRGQAESASRAAAASLAEHGLGLNPDKSRISASADGFRYLGYLFVNDLAVDVSGHKSETQVKPEIPPNSWLARLAGRTPLPVDGVEISRHSGMDRRNPDCMDAPNPRHPWSLGSGVPCRNDEETLNSTALPPEGEGAKPAKIGAMDDLGQMLCITGERATLSTHAGRLRVERGEQTLHDLPWRNLQAVVLFGSHTLTTPALQAALKQAVPVHFAGAVGGYRGVLWTGRPAEPGCGLWLKQANLFADPANALLSFGYTLLNGYVETLLHADGLLPWLGFYHQAHGRHATLASDLMEPFRHLVERTVLSAVQRHELKAQDFFIAANGACMMQKEARRVFFAQLLDRFNTPLAAYGEDVALTPVQHIHRQNLSLTGWLMRGEAFQAFRTR